MVRVQLQKVAFREAFIDMKARKMRGQGEPSRIVYLRKRDGNIPKRRGGLRPQERFLKGRQRRGRRPWWESSPTKKVKRQTQGIGETPTQSKETGFP